MVEAGTPENELSALERERLHLADVGKRLLGPAVHQVLGALTSIDGFSEFLLHNEVDAPQRRELLGTIHRQAEQMQSLLRELVDLFQLESMAGRDLQLSLQSLTPLVREAIAACQSAGKDLKVDLKIAEPLPSLLIDPNLMQQAIAQLVSNCLSHSSEHQTVRISLRQARDPGFIELEVHDRHASLKGEKPGRMFEPFYRANKVDQQASAPCGLSAARQIAALHGGTLECHAPAKGGINVILRLPIRH
jgi:signal transduction histidine kinase